MMDRLPPLKAVQAFEATARHLSFSRAADELCVTQSAISHQVRALEDFMGKRLLLRQGKHVALTQDGDTFYSVIGDCFDRMASVTSHLVRPSRATLKLMAQTSLAAQWLAPRLVGFRTANPDIEIFLDTEMRDVNFDPNAFDVVVGTWPTPAGFVTRKLREESWFPVCAPALFADIDPEDPASLVGHTLLSSENGADWTLWAQHQQLRLPPSPAMQHFSLALLAAKAAEGGAGIALACDFVAADAIRLGLLKPLRAFAYPLPWGHYHVHYRSDSHKAKEIGRFVVWLENLCRPDRAGLDA